MRKELTEPAAPDARQLRCARERAARSKCELYAKSVRCRVCGVWRVRAGWLVAMSTRSNQTFVSGSEESKIFNAVMAMKQAIGIALQHGDIRQDAVCSGIGMSTSELTHWINSKTQSSWDTKVAEWLKRTQGRALEAGSKSTSNDVKATKAELKSKPVSKLSKAEAGALSQLKQDLTELEDYIPWNAVVPSWGTRRAAWARRVKECEVANEVAKQLSLLEQALVEPALLPSWRSDVHAEWLEELLCETSSSQVLELLREMEDHIRWRAFKVVEQRQEGLRRLLSSPAGVLLREARPVDDAEEKLNLKLFKERVSKFRYVTEGVNDSPTDPALGPALVHRQPAASALGRSASARRP